MNNIPSLRKKRSVKLKIGAPKQITTAQQPPVPQPTLPSLERPRLPNNDSSSSIGTQRSKPVGADKTADYVKRRYSQKITALPKDFDTPTLPTIPSDFLAQPPARAGGRVPSGGTGEKVAVDLRALQDPHLPAEQYVANLLANASESDIREYQHDLGKIKNRTFVDLQHNVYQNRSQFIKISQEAERLKGEMRSLRSLMSELTTTLGQTNAALGITATDSTTLRKYANRSSVANLEAMWSSHLQELWRRVEGSQKFLPAIPGRHVVHESGRWVELNTATFKPRKRVHLILLNDHLLIASEKKRANETQQQDPRNKSTATQSSFVTDKCLPLQDVEITDLATKTNAQNPAARRGSRANMAAAVTLRIGNDSFTYATTDLEGSEKNSFLARFRKAVADLRKLLQTDLDDRPNARTAATLQSRTAEPPQGSKSTNGIIEVSTGTRSSMLVDVEGRQQSFRWVETQVDELDIDIALQRFEESVDRVERLRRIAKSNKNNTVIQDLVDGKVQERAGKLANTITRQLVDRNRALTATQQHVKWMIKLGFEAAASETFLDARTHVIRASTSQCIDQGDLGQYLFQVSYIYFTLIRNTVNIYQKCGFAPAMASACVKWAKEQVDEFNELLLRQMNKTQRGSQEWNDCLEQAREHANILSDVGIEFGNLIGKGLDGVET